MAPPAVRLGVTLPLWCLLKRFREYFSRTGGIENDFCLASPCCVSAVSRSEVIHFESRSLNNESILLHSGSSNVKTADARCIRYASYIMKSSGRLGEWCVCDFKIFVTTIHRVRCGNCFCLCSFICDNCLKKSGKTRKENKFSAKSKCRLLPPNTLLGFPTMNFCVCVCQDCR